MIEVKVIRKVKSYLLGIGGVGTMDWEVELECGHVLKKKMEELKSTSFQSEYECNACEKRAIHALENYNVVKD